MVRIAERYLKFELYLCAKRNKPGGWTLYITQNKHWNCAQIHQLWTELQKNDLIIQTVNSKSLQRELHLNENVNITWTKSVEKCHILYDSINQAKERKARRLKCADCLPTRQCQMRPEREQNLAVQMKVESVLHNRQNDNHNPDDLANNAVIGTHHCENGKERREHVRQHHLPFFYFMQIITIMEN